MPMSPSAHIALRAATDTAPPIALTDPAALVAEVQALLTAHGWNVAPTPAAVWLVGEGAVPGLVVWSPRSTVPAHPPHPTACPPSRNCSTTPVPAAGAQGRGEMDAMPATAMSVIRTYATEVVRLRLALRALDEWCPSHPPEPLRAEIAELLRPGRRAASASVPEGVTPWTTSDSPSCP